MKKFSNEEIESAKGFLSVLIREVNFIQTVDQSTISIKHPSGYQSEILKLDNDKFKVVDSKTKFKEADFTNSLCRLRFEILRHAYPENFEGY